MTKERFATHGNTLPLTSKDVILDVAQQHNYDLARGLSYIYIACVSDLPFADCEYHVRCYNRFMKIPK